MEQLQKGFADLLFFRTEDHERHQSGNLPTGKFLPSLEKLAKENQVSVSTVRRTLALLNDLGIIKSLNGKGSQILSISQIMDNCDLSNPAVQNRLMDHAQCLQLFALSCREVAEATISAMDAETIEEWKKQLCMFKSIDRLDIASSLSLSFLVRFAPYQSLRTIYSELFKQLIWGYPLTGMIGDKDTVNAFYLPYLDGMVSCLEQYDSAGFAFNLDELLCHEVEFVAKQLLTLGIQEAEAISISK